MTIPALRVNLVQSVYRAPRGLADGHPARFEAPVMKSGSPVPRPGWLSRPCCPDVGPVDVAGDCTGTREREGRSRRCFPLFCTQLSGITRARTARSVLHGKTDNNMIQLSPYTVTREPARKFGPVPGTSVIRVIAAPPLFQLPPASTMCGAVAPFRPPEVEVKLLYVVTVLA